MLGTNGGGFFNANAAHPFENPTALSNFVQIDISIFAIGAALTNVFGRMVGNQRQGWAILAVMSVLFIAGVTVVIGPEAHGNDALTAMDLPAATWKARKCALASSASRCLPSLPRLLPAAPSTPCTTPSRRSAA